MTEEQKLFWKLANNEIKASQLPLWYIKKDTRTYCLNEKCFLRTKCEMYKRYLDNCRTYGKTYVKAIIENPYALNPEQYGVLPCEFFIENL